MHHFEFSTMTLAEHDCVVKERHESKLREHWKEQNLAKEMLQVMNVRTCRVPGSSSRVDLFQFQYMNQGFQNNDMTAVSQSNFCSSQDPSNTVTTSCLDSVDQYFFLQPVTAKKRRKLLRFGCNNTLVQCVLFYSSMVVARGCRCRICAWNLSLCCDQTAASVWQHKSNYRGHQRKSFKVANVQVQTSTPNWVIVNSVFYLLRVCTIAKVF